VLSLRIRGQLPGPVVNGGGDRFLNWKDFQLSRTRDLDHHLGSDHTAYCRASLIGLCSVPTFQTSAKSKKLFVDGRTYVRMDRG